MSRITDIVLISPYPLRKEVLDALNGMEAKCVTSDFSLRPVAPNSDGSPKVFTSAIYTAAANHLDSRAYREHVREVLKDRPHVLVLATEEGDLRGHVRHADLPMLTCTVVGEFKDFD